VSRSLDVQVAAVRAGLPALIRRNYGKLVFGFSWATVVMVLAAATAHTLSALGSQIVLP
jgi:hypothetical protein